MQAADQNSQSTPDSDQFNPRGGAGDSERPHQNSEASDYASDDEWSLGPDAQGQRPQQQQETPELRRQRRVPRGERTRSVVNQPSSSSSSEADSGGDVEALLFPRLVPHPKIVQHGMVLDPKFSNRNDYGSIHSNNITPLNSQRNSTHALLTPRLKAASREVSALEDEREDVVPATSSTMTQGDLYQRQPLLPTPTKSEKWNNAGNEYFDEEEDDGEEILRNGIISSNSNGLIKISMPPPQREEPKFPKEKWKTFMALFIMIINFILTTASLALVHERVPDRDKYDPLPDKFLDTIPALDWALDVSEYLIMISVNATALVLIFHKHRFIVFRRVFLILSLLYMMRALTMYITVLPVASKTYYCSPKANQTSAYVITTRVLQLISGFGLSVNGKHTYCGDYIYSGHTVILVLSYLLISEYSPKKFFPLHWISWTVSTVGIVMVLLAHGHYSVDVVIAYYVTTRLFWTYHTLANNTQLKKSGPGNYLAREWWFACFQYFEKNVGGPVPRQYDWPLPWPRRCHSKSRDS